VKDNGSNLVGGTTVTFDSNSVAAPVRGDRRDLRDGAADESLERKPGLQAAHRRIGRAR
jgi:hypothetical protein